VVGGNCRSLGDAPNDTGGSGVSIRDRLRGPQVSKARPGAPFDLLPGGRFRVIPFPTRPARRLLPMNKPFLSKLATRKSAARDDKGESGFLPSRWLLGWREPLVPPLRYPGFPVELSGLGEEHAAFFKESRIRGHRWFRDVGNPGTLRLG
jgi:hypothetical protein